MSMQTRDHALTMTSGYPAAAPAGHEPSLQLVNGLNGDEHALLARLDAALAAGAALDILATQYSTLSGLACMQFGRVFLTGVSYYQLENRSRGPA
jgi:hypothetical protein